MKGWTDIGWERERGGCERARENVHVCAADDQCSYVFRDVLFQRY